MKYSGGVCPVYALACPRHTGQCQIKVSFDVGIRLCISNHKRGTKCPLFVSGNKTLAPAACLSLATRRGSH